MCKVPVKKTNKDAMACPIYCCCCCYIQGLIPLADEKLENSCRICCHLSSMPILSSSKIHHVSQNDPYFQTPCSSKSGVDSSLLQKQVQSITNNRFLGLLFWHILQNPLYLMLAVLKYISCQFNVLIIIIIMFEYCTTSGLIQGQWSTCMGRTA